MKLKNIFLLLSIAVINQSCEARTGKRAIKLREIASEAIDQPMGLTQEQTERMFYELERVYPASEYNIHVDKKNLDYYTERIVRLREVASEAIDQPMGLTQEQTEAMFHELERIYPFDEYNKD